MVSGERRRTIEKYEGKWDAVRDFAAAVIDSGERDLSRAVRLVDAEERALRDLEEAGELSIDTVTLDLFGDKYKNPGSLIVWHAPGG